MAWRDLLLSGDPWSERLGDAWRGFRARKLADRNFRRRAAAFPLTRPIARRNANALFDLTAGFVYSQILKAVVDLDLLGKLIDGPKTAGDLSGALGLKPKAAEQLLNAAAALDLVEARRDGAFEIGSLGSALQSEPGVRAMIAHHDMLYADLADPVALLQGEVGGTRLSRFWPYAAGDGGAVGDEEVAPYSALMHESQSFVADDVLDVVSFGDRNSLLDLGGGEGAFAEAAATRWPHLRIGLIDLAPVAARARARLAAAGFPDSRIDPRGGDFLAGVDGAKADVVSLIRVLHDHDDETAVKILRVARDALTPSGEVLIAEPLAGMRGARRVGHAYFAFYLMAMGSGQPRTSDEISELLAAAGFGRVNTRLTRGALPIGVITARRAGEGPIWRD
ncbi:methyltransferase [Methylopila turkensis]|uniref:O-methyltransferase n=1 Tax=Methylopila turkensis TaxID=1437816 RepID=A0A9W6JIH2_9HYPH|nr:methyltransferase [Methylopila turkensis]GLK78270.1 O-methyltransferase [Methylopila turkensis]